MRVVAVVVAGALVVGLAGCGGSPESRTAFVHDSERICRRANVRFARVHVVSPTAREAEHALGIIVGIGRAAVDDLRKLKPPKTSSEQAGAWLGLLEQALDEVVYAQTLLHGDEIVRAAAALARADVLTRRARALGRDLGVARACEVPRLLPDD